MKRLGDFAVSDPVFFHHGRKHITGHIAKKTPKKAMVVSASGDEYRVPWSLLHADPKGTRKRVQFEVDRLKAQFRPDDEVEFTDDTGVYRGVVARLGPKRALVVMSDKEEYYVPYSILKRTGRPSFRHDKLRFVQVTRVAERLMREHGLKGWSFQFDDASRRAGICDYGMKVIGLSRQFCVQAPNKEVHNTILHEIAHALVGPRHNHDAVWKAKAREIGCTGDRCHDVIFAPPKYIVWCPRCLTTWTKNVQRRGMVCATCRTPTKYKTYTKKGWEDAKRYRRF